MQMYIVDVQKTQVEETYFTYKTQTYKKTEHLSRPVTTTWTTNHLTYPTAWTTTRYIYESRVVNASMLLPIENKRNVEKIRLISTTQELLLDYDEQLFNDLAEDIKTGPFWLTVNKLLGEITSIMYNGKKHVFYTGVGYVAVKTVIGVSAIAAIAICARKISNFGYDTILKSFREFKSSLLY